MPEKKSAIADYDNMLKNRVKNKDLVKINRTFKYKNANLSGVILDMSKTFILIQLEEEFLLNGYAIIRKDQVDSLRSNKYDKTKKKILKGEGVFDRDYGLDIQINLTDWPSIFKDLKKHDYHVIVECEEREKPLFEIGPVRRIAKNSLSIQYYDPTGLLEDKLTSIKYNNITTVQFGDRYTTTFRKYLRTK